MEPKYTYTPSQDYINQLPFDYIETYSFQRGEDYEEEIKRLQIEHNRLKVKKEKSFSSEEAMRLEKLNRLFGFTQYLIDANEEFHFSSAKTNTFTKDDDKVEALIQILKIGIKEVPAFLCSPEYRDAIVFYNNNGNRISVLNVCLSCRYMETKPFHHINGDFETYDLLKRWFLNIGHHVENPNHFIMDEINRVKEKHNKAIVAKQTG